MSKNNNPVPRLDLAPKLKRPLSLWNPLDYLRLLYWVFFFPQAVRWYVETFGGGFIFYPKPNWRKGWNFLLHNPIEFQLFLQGLALILFTQLTLRIIFQIGGIPIERFSLFLIMGMIIGVAFSFGNGVAVGVTLSVVLTPMFIVSKLLVSALITEISNQVILQSAIAALIWGISWGVPFSVGICLAISVGSAQIEKMLNKLGELPQDKKEAHWEDHKFIIIFFVVSTGLWLLAKILLGNVAGILEDLVLLVTTFVIACIAGIIAFLRPENWLSGLPWVMRSFPNKYQMLPRVTLIPVPNLSNQLKSWLRNDWETGLENANQLLAYTFQFFPVVQAINQVLKEIPLEQILFRVAQLAEDAYSWRVVYYASQGQTIKLTKIEPRLDTIPNATAAGFWYLHEKQPEKSTEAFAVVRDILYGEEMFVLAQTLASFYNAKE
ncbi:MAG: ATP-binding protein, partial [Okeania sp. SIO2H7]|nr:ATP-binding protein [Okeania sp. SIO2H7]